MASRAGRKRKGGVRYPSGDLVLKPALHGITPEALQQRAAAAGLACPQIDDKAGVLDLAHKKSLGLAIGVLRERRLINAAEYHAARAFESLWRQWRSMAGVMSPWEMLVGHGPSTPFDHLPYDRQVEILEKFAEMMQRMKSILAKFDKLPQKAFVRATVEAIVIENVLPAPFFSRPAALEALRKGLRVLCEFFPLDDKMDEILGI